MSKTRKGPSRPFVMVYKDLLKDPEWRKLSSSSKVVYIYLRSKFNRETLGEVSLAYSEMRDMMSSKTISRSFKELQERKFIEKIKYGGLFGGTCTYRFTGPHRCFPFKGYSV